MIIDVFIITSHQELLLSGSGDVPSVLLENEVGQLRQAYDSVHITLSMFLL